MRLTDEEIEALRQRCDEAERALMAAMLVTGEMGIELSALKALLDVDRLEQIITDSIDLDWTPRTAAMALVRALKGQTP